MSAFAQKSDGIADTHLHWDEVEQEMQSALGTKATFGSEKSFKNIGEGNGMMSRTCLINPDWQNVSEDLPKAFVLKICTPITAIEFSSHLNGTEATAMAKCIEQACTRVHNNEVNTYNLLKKYDEGRIPLPKIYASRKFDEVNTLKGFLIMEYFDELTPYHYTNNVTIDAVKQCLRSVAIWEGIGERFTDEERSTFTTKYLSETFGDMYKEDVNSEL